ncbi:MAG: alpha/beta hydrolase [Xanthomonadaceae bacterium]|nr:alpha/beta hydrolase [Xanthomonadaceae bacterium]
MTFPSPGGSLLTHPALPVSQPVRLRSRPESDLFPDPMTASLSLRARLFGPVSQFLLQPVLAAPAAEMRPKLERIAGLITRIPRGTRIESITLAGRPAEKLTPKGSGSRQVIYYMHGGAYLGGSPRTHRGMLAHIAQAAGATVIALDYRLAPEHPYPAALEDAVSGWKALLAQGIKPANLVLGGDSAGGNLALVTAIALRDAGLPLPAGLVLLSPWTDLSSSGASMGTRAERDRVLTVRGIDRAAREFANGLPLADPRLSPLFARLEGLPKTLIQVGDDEVLLDDSVRLADAARKAGVDVTIDLKPQLWHVWQVMAGWMPEADQAVAAIGSFVRSLSR